MFVIVEAIDRYTVGWYFHFEIGCPLEATSIPTDAAPPSIDISRAPRLSNGSRAATPGLQGLPPPV